ncbi:MAG: SurA N-terminal domain-containing protein [Coriobacteriales bacterium]|nr:SurA N-terminal domain-containing protein [Coriobacteriales bacterium]
MILYIVCASIMFAGCDDTSQSSNSIEQITQEAADHAGIDRKDVAAVVEGNVITHKQVNAYIEEFRQQNNLVSNQAYKEYLDNNGITQDDIRYRAIKELVDTVLIEVDAARHDISISQEDIVAQINKLASKYPNKTAWREALKGAGYTEDAYRANIKKTLLINALYDNVIPEVEPTHEQIEEYAVVVAPTLIGKRSSQILFSSDDYAIAYETLLKIVNGADFSAMAIKYSIDSSALDGGDMGWDCINTFIRPYQTALDRLDVGEVSPVIQSGFGYHIILCTERYDAPLNSQGNIDIDAIPPDILDYIIQMMSSVLKKDTYNTYIGNLEATATLAVFDEQGEQIPLETVGFATQTTNL